jgi:hypothetical protein
MIESSEQFLTIACNPRAYPNTFGARFSARCFLDDMPPILHHCQPMMLAGFKLPVRLSESWRADAVETAGIICPLGDR